VFVRGTIYKGGEIIVLLIDEEMIEKITEHEESLQFILGENNNVFSSRGRDTWNYLDHLNGGRHWKRVLGKRNDSQNRGGGSRGL